MRNIITPFRNASNPWLFKELSNCVSSKTKLSSSESCALFRLWNLHNQISTLVQPFKLPALKNTYICDHFSQWNDPSWRNAGGASEADFLLNQTPCVSLLYPSSHDRNQFTVFWQKSSEDVEGNPTVWNSGEEHAVPKPLTSLMSSFTV